MKNLETLLPTLQSATDSQTISWEETPVPDQYRANLTSKYSLLIWPWEDDEDNTSGISISLTRDNKMIDIVVANSYMPVHADVRAIHIAARRSANKVEEAIEEIEKDLMFRI